jgi:hypothetical protein
MGVTVKVHSADYGIYNIPEAPEAGDPTTGMIKIIGTPSSTEMNFGVTYQGTTLTLKITGTFSYPGGTPQSFADLTTNNGNITKWQLSANGTLLEEVTFSPAVSPIQFWNAFENLSSATAIYSGADVFIGVTNPPANGENDIADGFSGNDTFYGNGSASSTDKFYGGAGIDTSVLRGKKSEYVISSGTFWNEYTKKTELPGFQIKDNVSQRDGTQQTSGVERLKFSDTHVALDLDGNAGTAVKLIAAVFGKSAISNKEYVGIGLNLLDSGVSYAALGDLALNAAGLKTADQIVSALWKNVVGTTGTTENKAPFIDLLQKGMTGGELVKLAADTSINTTNIDLVGLSKTGIEYQFIA